MGADQVRLVLPLRVVEEMDEKKYMARPDLADRARRLMSQLWALLEPSAGGPAQLREGVTIEVPIDNGPRHRPPDADQEVLDTCELLRNVGQPVVLVTGDCGMSLRGTALSVEVVEIPYSLRRTKPEPPDTDAAADPENTNAGDR